MVIPTVKFNQKGGKMRGERKLFKLKKGKQGEILEYLIVFYFISATN